MHEARRREPRPSHDHPAPDGPVRTCVGCRRSTSATELLRVVADDGRLVLDLKRRLPGRGAWLHPDPACLHRAQRRNAFGHALRVKRPMDATALSQYLGENPER